LYQNPQNLRDSGVPKELETGMTGYAKLSVRL